jgi:hypothetical protein
MAPTSKKTGSYRKRAKDIQKRLKQPNLPTERAKLTKKKKAKTSGLKGGKAREVKLTQVQRAEIARLVAGTRWKKSR